MTAQNIEIIQKAMAELIETGDVDALAPLLSDGFVHHRPDANSRTKAEWLAAVRASWEKIADMRVEVLQVLGDGDRVVMYSRRSLPDGPEVVVVDFWRFEGGLIAEAWEVIEPVARAAANLSWWEPARG
ncbi:nuclear transport factor 2 family protein [Spirillospora sp. NBC_00431]